MSDTDMIDIEDQRPGVQYYDNVTFNGNNKDTSGKQNEDDLSDYYVVRDVENQIAQLKLNQNISLSETRRIRESNGRVNRDRGNSFDDHIFKKIRNKASQPVRKIKALCITKTIKKTKYTFKVSSCKKKDAQKCIMSDEDSDHFEGGEKEEEKQPEKKQTGRHRLDHKCPGPPCIFGDKPIRSTVALQHAMPFPGQSKNVPSIFDKFTQEDWDKWFDDIEGSDAPQPGNEKEKDNLDDADAEDYEGGSKE